MGETEAPAAQDPVRAFDFWIGRWVVSDPHSGELLGHSRIEPILGGRAIHERWAGASGLEGESLNIYDEQCQRWHQTWVSANGMLLLLDGGLRDGAMQMQGGEPLQRIRWTPQAGGAVLQQWDMSEDSGASWTMQFEGLYRAQG
jgi:hypothetical protein